MKAFGGACPMCCGDAVTDVVAVCMFCGFLLDGDPAVGTPATAPVLSKPSAGAIEILALPSAPAAAPSSLERLRYVG